MELIENKESKVFLSVGHLGDATATRLTSQGK